MDVDFVSFSIDKGHNAQKPVCGRQWVCCSSSSFIIPGRGKTGGAEVKTQQSAGCCVFLMQYQNSTGI